MVFRLKLTIERYNDIMVYGANISGFFSSDRFKNSFKSSLAFVSAFGLALALGLDYPIMSSVATVILSLSSLGESMIKSVMRALATLMGVFMGLTLVAIFPQYIWSYLLASSIVVGIFSYFAYANKTYSYFFFLSIFTMLIVWDRANTFEELILFAFGRVEETYLGIMVFFLINVFIWPKHTQSDLENQIRHCFTTEHDIFSAVVYGDAQQTIKLKHSLRKDIFNTISLYRNAVFDSVNVHALKENYKSYIYLTVQIKRTLYGLHTLFQDASFRDIRHTYTNEDALFKQIDRLFSSNEPFVLSTMPLTLIQKVPRLAESQETYHALYTHYLQQLQMQLLDLRRLQDATEHYQPMKLTNVTLSAYKSNWVWFDHDALRVVARVMVTFYAIIILWISLDMQGGFLIVAYGVGYTIIASALFPFGFKKVLVPYNIGAFIAMTLYCTVIVNITTYYALALLLFSYVFATNYIFTGQRKTFHIRMLYPIFLMDLANHQLYSFESYFNHLIIFEIILILVSLGSYFPFCWRPEKLMAQLQKRYVKQCASLMRHHHTYLTKRNKLSVRLYYNYFYSHVLFNVDKMQQYADNIDYGYFHSNAKEEIERFITTCRDFSFLCKELHISEEYGFFKMQFHSFKAYEELKIKICELLDSTGTDYNSQSETVIEQHEYAAVRNRVFELYRNREVTLEYVAEVLKRLYIYERLHLKALFMKQMQQQIDWNDFMKSRF